MIDPKLPLNEAIDLFISYLFAKQDQLYENPENLIPAGWEYQGHLKRSANLELKKLIDLDDILNDYKD